MFLMSIWIGDGMFVVTEQLEADTYRVVDVYDNVEEIVSKRYLGKLRKTFVLDEFCGLTARAIRPMGNNPVLAVKEYLRRDKKVVLNKITQTGADYFCNTIPENIAALEIAFRRVPHDESEAKAYHRHTAIIKCDSDRIESVTYMQIPWGVEFIEVSEFYDACNLQTLELPTSLHVIYSNCFRSCSSLKSIVIPRNVFSIGNGAFSGATSLRCIDVDAANACYKSIDGMLYNKQGTMLLCCPSDRGQTVVVPEGVVCLGRYAFSYFNGNRIVLPKTLQYLEHYSFDNCSSLVNLELPDGLKAIDGWCFHDCDNLAELRVPSSVEEIGSYAFYHCERLKKIVVEGMHTRTYVKAFNGSADDCKIYCLKGSYLDLNKDRIVKNNEKELSKFRVVTSLKDILG